MAMLLRPISRKNRLEQQKRAMKEPDYSMSLMSTFGTANKVETASTRRDVKFDGVTTRISFKHMEVIITIFGIETLWTIKIRNGISLYRFLRLEDPVVAK